MGRLFKVMVALFAILTFSLVIFFFCQHSIGHPSAIRRQTIEAIQTLQPAVDYDRAHALAIVFDTAGYENDLDPLLLVSIAMRESSLLQKAEDGRYIGSKGERGLLQIHGTALKFRPEGCSKTLEKAWCQIHTGARFLAYCRDRCGGSPWRWVGAYGMKGCPAEQFAGMHPSLRTAHRYYLKVRGFGWSNKSARYPSRS